MSERNDALFNEALEEAAKKVEDFRTAASPEGGVVYWGKSLAAAIRSLKREEAKRLEPRMDGTLEEQLLWRVGALREALEAIATTDDPSAAIACARNAIGVDNHNIDLMSYADLRASGGIEHQVVAPVPDAQGAGWIEKTAEYVRFCVFVHLQDRGHLFSAKLQDEVGDVIRRAILRHAPSPAPVGNVAGWKYVPVEPTEEMLVAAYGANIDHAARCDNKVEYARSHFAPRYRAMLAAAPTPPTPSSSPPAEEPTP